MIVVTSYSTVHTKTLPVTPVTKHSHVILPCFLCQLVRTDFKKGIRDQLYRKHFSLGKNKEKEKKNLK